MVIITPSMALTAHWLMLSPHPAALEEMLILMMTRPSLSGHKGVGVLCYLSLYVGMFLSKRSIDRSVTVSFLLQVMSCSWWLPMSLVTPWDCLILLILVLSCTPFTHTATLTLLFCPGMMSMASSLSMVSTKCLFKSTRPICASIWCDEILTVIQHPGPNPDNPVGPGPQPPTTPDACDSKLVLDAVTTLRGEMYFFKGRYDWHILQGLHLNVEMW